MEGIRQVEAMGTGGPRPLICGCLTCGTLGPFAKSPRFPREARVPEIDLKSPIVKILNSSSLKRSSLGYVGMHVARRAHGSLSFIAA